MTVKELQIVLDRIPNPKPSYSLCGLEICGYCLNDNSGLYSVYEMDERGNKSYYVTDVSEKEACDVLYKKVVADIKLNIDTEYDAIFNRVARHKEQQSKCFIASSDGVIEIKY